MKPISSLWPALLLTLCAHGALAQTPSAAPPKLEKIEEVADDPITVNARPEAQHRITEKRANDGSVTEATVKSGPSTYTVRPKPTTGTALPGDTFGSANRGPQWTVMEFDLGKKKQKSKDEDAASDDNAPPAVAK